MTTANPTSPIRMASPLLIPCPGLTSVVNDALSKALSVTSPLDFMTLAIASAWVRLLIMINAISMYI